MTCIERHVRFCAYLALEEHRANEPCILKYPVYRGVVFVSILGYFAAKICERLFAT